MSLQPSPTTGVQTVVTSLADGVRLAAFWAAIALPFLHLPLLYRPVKYADAFLVLLVLNVVCLLVGHRYRRPD